MTNTITMIFVDDPNDLLKERDKYKQRLRDPNYVPVVAFRKNRPQTPCLHNVCPDCNGTGNKQWGSICVHMISCPCSSCSPRAV